MPTTTATNARDIELGTVTVGEDPFAEARARKFCKDEVLLVLDARHACYRAFYTRDLSGPDGRPTSALHGVLEIVSGACAAFNTRRFVLVWDGSVESKRKIHPGYKARHDTDPTPEERAQRERASLSIKVAREGFDMLGLPQLFHPKFEGDDLVGCMSRYAIAARSDPVDPGHVVIVTDDKDHYQLVSTHVSVWRGIVKRLIDIRAFASMYAFPPARWADYKALVGEDPSADNIPGVAGFGDVTAAKFIAVHGNLEAAIAYAKSRVAAPKSKPHKVEIALANGETDARLSYRLSRLCLHRDDLAAWDPDAAPGAMCAIRDAYIEAVQTSRPLSLATVAKFRGRFGFSEMTLASVLPPMGYPRS